MHTTQTRPAASSRNSAFARAAVFAEFQPPDARHLDQAGFIDRQPDQLPHRHIETNLDGEEHFVSQVGGEAST